MKRFLVFIIAMLCWGGALADDLVARNGNDTVRLTQQACHTEVLPLLAMVYPAAAERFRAAYAQVDGADYRACWILRPDGKVLLQYEDTDAGLIPWADFKRAPSI
jgi:hypothetical protein